MRLHLLDLPPELLEHILVILLCHTTDARSIQACRQTCHALNATIAQSKLVQYLERLALLGLYDPALALLIANDGSSLTLALPDRAAALQAWEDAWDALMGGGGGDSPEPQLFWQRRRPDLLISHPPHPPSSWPSSPRVKYILAKIVEPDPPLMHQLVVESATATTEGQEYSQLGQQHGYLDDEDRFSFGPWFIAATRDGLNVRASYSYLDLHGCLPGGGGGNANANGADSESNSDSEFDRAFWTVIKIPLWNVVAFVLSTELDLTVVISVSRMEDEYWEEEGEGREMTTTHLVLRPLRFRDGTPHPCARVPAMRLCVRGATVFLWAQAQVLGDYLLLWVGPGRADYNLCKLYLVAWKTGTITLLREFPSGMYGAIPAMISDDVLALVQLDPPGIELCRISNMGKEVAEDDEAGGEAGGRPPGGDRDDDRGGASGSGASSGGATKEDEPSIRGRPRMDKLCTLLLPPLRQGRDGTGARAVWTFCVGEHPGHHTFSRGPWPEYRRARLGRRRVFRQSTRDSIVCVVMQIEGCEDEERTFEFVVRCETLLAYADAARGARVVLEGDGDGNVPWAAWGPRATALSDQTHVEWRYLLGERRATIEGGADRTVRIRDYNPYRIRQARASMVAKGAHEIGDSHEDEGVDLVDEGEGEGIVDTFHSRGGTRRITEGWTTTRAGQWFEHDVRTALAHLTVALDVPGCREIYMEQDQVLVRVDDIDKITERPNRNHRHRMNGGRDVDGDGFALYGM